MKLSWLVVRWYSVNTYLWRKRNTTECLRQCSRSPGRVSIPELLIRGRWVTLGGSEVGQGCDTVWGK